VNELLSRVQSHVAAVLEAQRDIVAYLAALAGTAFAQAGAKARTLNPLRWLAVARNLGYIVFGVLHPQYTTLLVALLLLPLNVHRARQMARLTRRVKSAVAEGDFSGLWLRPYMKARRVKAGTVLFEKGDPADRLYCLVDGQVELSDIGERLEPGQVFGEVAFFAPDRQRTHTARCVTDGTVLSIDETTFRQLYYQNPSFGFYLIGLLAGHLSKDVRRLSERLAAREAAFAARGVQE
jgi:CRP-like cAMP-binding protein